MYQVVSGTANPASYLFRCCHLPKLTLYGHIKTAEQRTINSNTVIVTLAVDRWAVTFGTARRGLAGLGPRPVPSLLYQI